MLPIAAMIASIAALIGVCLAAYVFYLVGQDRKFKS